MNRQQGPCLSWCFSIGSWYYMFLGFILGILSQNRKEMGNIMTTLVRFTLLFATKVIDTLRVYVFNVTRALFHYAR